MIILLQITQITARQENTNQIEIPQKISPPEIDQSYDRSQYQRTFRAIVFRPLFVYRQQQRQRKRLEEKERMKTRAPTNRLTQVSPRCPYAR